MLPQKAKNAIRGCGIIGVAAIVLGVALLILARKTLGVAARHLNIYFVVSGVITSSAPSSRQDCRPDGASWTSSSA